MDWRTRSVLAPREPDDEGDADHQDDQDFATADAHGCYLPGTWRTVPAAPTRRKILSNKQSQPGDSVGLKQPLRRLAAMVLHGGTTMKTLTENQISESRRVFDLCDLNGDGFIDQDEFHVLLVRLDGDVSREECELDFEAADTAGDGFIEFREFVAWWTN
jgi:calmodulin